MKIIISKSALAERCANYEYVFDRFILGRGRVNRKQIPAYDLSEEITLTEKELNSCGLWITNRKQCPQCGH